MTYRDLQIILNKMTEQQLSEEVKVLVCDYDKAVCSVSRITESVTDGVCLEAI